MFENVDIHTYIHTHGRQSLLYYKLTNEPKGSGELKIRMHEKKSLFELNEKVLRNGFKINFGVRTARVFELKKNLSYTTYYIAWPTGHK